MPHARERHVLPLLVKRLSFSPVVALQGARQVGKSFLVRELLKRGRPSLVYQTFDQASVRAFAASNPETFLSQYEDASPLVVDEAQKVPAIFDAVKYEVDRLRRPGCFLLLGSTEFSKMTLIRESLTGRMSRVRLFPMSVGEALGIGPNRSKSPVLAQEKPRLSRAQLVNHLKRGGMPGIFAARSDEERESLLRDWLALTAERDIMLIPKLKLDSDLCMRIFELIATLDEPSAANIAARHRRAQQPPRGTDDAFRCSATSGPSVRNRQATLLFLRCFVREPPGRFVRKAASQLVGPGTTVAARLHGRSAFPALLLPN
jgi:predicted AAA+ superfamily ATPase